MDWHEWRGDTLVLKLHIKPRARAPGIDGLHGGRLRVRLGAPPVDGKANEELIGFFATAFALPRRAISIVHGEHGTSKTLELAAPRAVPAWFATLGGRACPGPAPAPDSRPRGAPCRGS